ncbi:ferredoxin [Candidatus Uhrbacteria bacterium]|nr:ferredoxin [Candidatus Uhrbacteria bacterium]
MPKLRIKVDPDLCIGAASCVAIAENYFELNADNKAAVKDPELPMDPDVFEREIVVTEEQKELILMGARSCPTLAVFVYDENGKQLFPET